MTQQPVLSIAEDRKKLNLGEGTRGILRMESAETNGAFSVVELIADPGSGVDVHTHEDEDELVHVLEGEIEVTLGDQVMRAGLGIVALLPRGIAHGFTNVGDGPCRVSVVILPGRFGEYFAKASDLYDADAATDEAFEALNREYRVHF